MKIDPITEMRDALAEIAAGASSLIKADFFSPKPDGIFSTEDLFQDMALVMD